MDANELRNNHKISNFRLLWAIHGHKIEVSELKNFSKEELRDIYRVDSREEYQDEVLLIMQSKGLSKQDALYYLEWFTGLNPQSRRGHATFRTPPTVMVGVF